MGVTTGNWMDSLRDSRTSQSSVIVFTGNLFDLDFTGMSTNGLPEIKPIISRTQMDPEGQNGLLPSNLLGLGFDAVIWINAEGQVQVAPPRHKGAIPELKLPERGSPEELALATASYMRDLVLQEDIPAEKRLNLAVVSEYAHIAWGPDEQARPVQKAWEAIIHSTARSAPLVKGHRNCLFFLVSRPEHFPWQLLSQCPDAGRIEIKLPTLAMREAWLGQEPVRNALLQNVAEPDRERLLRECVLATDGMRLEELVKIVRHVAAGEVQTPREALRLVRNGRTTSFWSGFSTDPEKRFTAWEGIHKVLAEGIIGQPKAVEKMTQIIGRAMVFGDTPSKGPCGLLLEVGPSGVGKTEMARLVAHALYGDDDALVRFNMNEYGDAQSLSTLKGAGAGFVGFENGSPLVKALKDRPGCVILFDEIEKAHGDVWTFLMNFFDTGEISDAVHGKAHANEAVIILSSNLGLTALQNEGKAETLDYDQITDFFERQVRKYLCSSVREGGLGHPELWGRLETSTIGFDILRDEFVPQVVEKFRTGFERVQRELGYPVSLDPVSTLDWARQALDPATGARGIATKFAGPLTLAFTGHLLTARKSIGTPTSIRFAENKPVFQ